jgi:hypothetical protein
MKDDKRLNRLLDLEPSCTFLNPADSFTIGVQPGGWWRVNDSPIEVYAKLLSDSNLTPDQAAYVVETHIPHKWKAISRPPLSGTPDILQSMWDGQAWERFASDNPVVRQQMGAYVLFRAAGHVANRNAVTLLMELGRSVISEIVNGWLYGQR